MSISPPAGGPYMLISKTAPRGGFESKLLIPGMLMVWDIVYLGQGEVEGREESGSGRKQRVLQNLGKPAYCHQYGPRTQHVCYN